MGEQIVGAGVDDADAAHEEEGRDDEAHEAEDVGRSPAEETLNKAEPIDQRQGVAVERTAATADDLHEPKAPAGALRDVFLQAFRREAESQGLVEVDGLEADFLQPQRHEVVFGDRIRRKSADRGKRLCPDDRGCSATDREPPGILGRHDHIEEESLLIRPDIRRDQVRLNRIAVHEMLRCLDDAYRTILEQRHGAAEKGGRGDEIRIEDRDELRLPCKCAEVTKTVVDVSGLGMAVIRSSEIPAADMRAEILEPFALSVIEDEDLIIRMVHRHRADDRTLEDRLFFIIGADQNCDERLRIQREKQGKVALDIGASAVGLGHEGKEDRCPGCLHQFDRNKENAESEAECHGGWRQGLLQTPTHVEKAETNRDENDAGSCFDHLAIQPWEECDGNQQDRKSWQERGRDEKCWTKHRK